MAYEVRRRAGIIGLDIVEVSMVIVSAENRWIVSSTNYLMIHLWRNAADDIGKHIS